MGLAFKEKPTDVFFLKLKVTHFSPVGGQCFQPGRNRVFPSFFLRPTRIQPPPKGPAITILFSQHLFQPAGSIPPGGGIPKKSCLQPAVVVNSIITPSAPCHQKTSLRMLAYILLEKMPSHNV